MQQKRPDEHRSASPAPLPRADAPRYQPGSADVDGLIARASTDRLGVDFLLYGELGTVAIWFRTHAFTVLAARDRLLTGAPPEAAS
jgi:hypothetical protein